MNLEPTLWRTCRVLANTRRLGMLRQLMLTPPMTVTQMARMSEVDEGVASLYLRALQARGLVRAQRVGRYVWYHPEADPSVAHAPPLLHALRTVMLSGPGAIVETRFVLTGFTHPRRLDIIRLLSEGARTGAELRLAIRMCARSLYRHLDKLERRGLVRRRDGTVRLATEGSELSRCLVTLASAAWRVSSPSSAPRRCRNRVPDSPREA